MNVAVPSHRRPGIFKEETLATLEAGGVSMRDVHLFLSDEEDSKLYSGIFPKSQTVITGAKNVVEKFNAIHMYYQPGAEVFVIEDDIKLVTGEGKANDARPLEDVRGMIGEGFEALAGEGLWGVVPHSNAFFFSGKISRTLKLIVAHAFGFVATHDPWLAVTQLGKSDYERTCRYWVKYGRVTRVDRYGVKTKSYTRPGGIQSDMNTAQRSEVEAASVVYLEQRFGHLVVRKNKKTSPFAEVRFKPSRHTVEQLYEMQHAVCRQFGDSITP